MMDDYENTVGRGDYDMRAALDRVRALHTPEPSYGRRLLCTHCRDVGLVATTAATWPCPTIRAIEGEDDE